MNIKTILCPVDYSDYSLSVNEYASMLASTTGATIIYLHSYLPNAFETPPAHYDFEKEKSRQEQRLKEFLKPTIEGVACKYVVDSGLAAGSILEYANKCGVDLIVMGTHGRTGLRRLLMGSVAEAVVRKAECPVLAIRDQNQLVADDSGESNSVDAQKVEPEQ